MPLTTFSEMRALRWLAGPQHHYDAPDPRDLDGLRDVGLARSERGRPQLTDAGRTRLEELERDSSATMLVAPVSTIRKGAPDR
jgi:hypothetical protein